MKKIVMALLIMIMVASVFAGCGNRTAEDGKVQAAMADAESDRNDGGSESGAEETATTESGPETTTESEGSSASEAETADVVTDTDSEDMAVEVGGAEEYSFVKMNETMYASSGVSVRDLPDTEGTKVEKFVKGQEVTITGQCVETGWYRVMVDGREMYVSDSFITAEKPSATTNGSGTASVGTTQTRQGAGSTTQARADATAQTASASNEVSTAFL